MYIKNLGRSIRESMGILQGFPKYSAGAALTGLYIRFL